VRARRGSHQPAQVKITAGKDKGQVGTIARVLRDQNRVVVEGFNLVRARRRRRRRRLVSHPCPALWRQAAELRPPR
jgi:ribosomal protein L24